MATSTTFSNRDTYPFKDRYRDAQSTNLGSASNSLTTVKLGSVAVAANTFVAGDILTVAARVDKYGAVATWNLFLYWNDTDDLTTPITIGTFTLASALTLQYVMLRRISIAVAAGTGNGSIIWPPGTSGLNDYTSSTTTVPTSAAFNWTTNGYIIIAGDVDSSSDYIQARWLKVSN